MIFGVIWEVTGGLQFGPSHQTVKKIILRDYNSNVSSFFRSYFKIKKIKVVKVVKEGKNEWNNNRKVFYRCTIEMTLLYKKSYSLEVWNLFGGVVHSFFGPAGTVKTTRFKVNLIKINGHWREV